MKHVTIPADWDAHEALVVVSFLERIIEAVWRAHGPAMADVLYEREVERLDRRSTSLAPVIPDDELPL